MIPLALVAFQDTISLMAYVQNVIMHVNYVLAQQLHVPHVKVDITYLEQAALVAYLLVQLVQLNHLAIAVWTHRITMLIILVSLA